MNQNAQQDISGQLANAGVIHEPKPVPQHLVPLQDRVLIRKAESAKVTKGGLHIPETSQDGETVTGEVVAVGPGRFDQGHMIPTSIRKGWTVLYFRHAGSKVKTPDGEELLCLMESEVIARVGGGAGVK